MTSKNTWKSRERQAAALFGTRRAPLSGSNGGQTASDSLHDRLFIETKLRSRHAVCTLFRQTAKLAATENKTPVVVLAEKHHAGLLICCRPEDIPVLAQNLGTTVPKPADCPCGRCRKIQEGE